jgi:hypothetical protein
MYPTAVQLKPQDVVVPPWVFFGRLKMTLRCLVEAVPGELYEPVKSFHEKAG